MSSLYVSAWYILGGLTFTLLAYPVGNVVPEYLPGAQGATFSGLWIHDAVGLFVTPLALAIAYAVIPAVSGRPIFSHFLSMIGFWLLFLIYPLNGTHHYVFSSIPMEAQKGAVVASVYLGADVVLVVTNLLLSLRGRSGTAAADTPLRYVWAGTVAYLIVSLQGSAQAIMPLNRFVHFSDWVIGHSHLAMIGFASFIGPGRPPARLAADAGLPVQPRGGGLVVLAAGPGPGGDGPRPDRRRAGPGAALAGRPAVDGLGSGLGPVLVGPLGVGLRAPGRVPRRRGGDDDRARSSPRPRRRCRRPRPGQQDDADEEVAGFRWLKNAYVLTAGAGFGLFAFSFVVLGLWPNRHARGADRPDAADRPPRPVRQARIGGGRSTPERAA